MRMHKFLENFKIQKNIPEENYAEYCEYIICEMEKLVEEEEEILTEILIYLLIFYKNINREKIYDLLEMRLQTNKNIFLNTAILISSYLNNRVEEKDMEILQRHKNLFVHDENFYAKLMHKNDDINFFTTEIISSENKIFPVNQFKFYFLQEILQKIENISNEPLNRKNKMILKKLYSALLSKVFEKELSTKKYLSRIANILFLNCEFFNLSQFKILSVLLEYDFKSTMQILMHEIKSGEQYVHSKLVMYFGVSNYKRTVRENLGEVNKFMQICEKITDLKKFLI